jgi:hypothetical protein
MTNQKKVLNSNEDGFVMIASLLILLVLTLLGIAVNKNTTTEWQISMNDRLHQEAFYSADAAAELAVEVVAQSLACPPQACANPPCPDVILKAPGAAGYDLAVLDPTFLQDFANLSKGGGTTVNIPSDDDRDMVFPAIFNGTGFDKDATDQQQHANINLGGDTKLTEGSAIQMAAGYEGLGKGLGSDVTFVYDIKVQQIGKNGSVSVICTQYRLKGLPCNDQIYE